MPKFEKLLPPPMRRPPKPGHSADFSDPNGAGGNGATALKEGEQNGNGTKTDDPGKRAIEAAKEAPVDLVGWVDERMGGTSFLTAMLLRKVPKETNCFYTLGAATLFAFLVQAITGVFL